ncbi:hypothetical protein Tco_0006588, partial [Tanacetum coccineum]
VLDLEKTKTTQHNKIASLKRRVKKFEKKDSLGEDASKQGRIDAIDADKEINLVSVHDMNVSAVSAAGDIVSTASAATTISVATTTTAIIKTVDDITLAQALEEMKSTKPKKKGVVIQELGESTTTIYSQLSSQQSQEKGKGVLIEPVKPMNKKNQIRLDEETALNLQAKFDEEERLKRKKAEKEEEANIALIETWDDIQVKIDADHQLAERMQAQEQEELSIEEKATLFQQLLEKRRKHFAAKRAEEKRNKPPTKAQQRKIIAFKWVEDDKETSELKQLMEIIPYEKEVAIDAIHLAVKSPNVAVVEKKYPLTPSTLSMMLEKKLIIDYESYGLSNIARIMSKWICQTLQEFSQKRTRERMSDQEAKEIKAEAREIMPQPSTAWSLYWSWMAAETPRVLRAEGQLIGLD